MVVATCIAPVNIAVIKYWGKRDENLILPLNDSISVTLSTEQMHAKTTVMASPNFTVDRIWLNGKEESMNNLRFKRCLEEIRKKCHAQGLQNEWKIHICSENNFPTAAGLASSAAGFACLVYTLAKAFKIEGDVSSLARLGSGSACRSVFGGFVQWCSGSADDGSDSVARQLFSSTHWPELRVIILVVNDKQKKVSSTSGMQRSVDTSEFLKYRVSNCLPQRIKSMTRAIAEKQFNVFAELTMKDSNQFHSVCLDTYPPAVYMNDTSHSIVEFVHSYNKEVGENRIAYTFDAGPNAFLFVQENFVDDVLSVIQYIFPPISQASQYIRGIPIISKDTDKDFSNIKISPHKPGILQYIIHTTVGSGPRELTNQNEHLLNPDGLPKFINGI